jgi:hypothetical protein
MRIPWTELEVGEEELSAAEHWLSNKKPVFIQGHTVLTLDRANRQPGIGVWQVGTIQKARLVPRWRILPAVAGSVQVEGEQLRISLQPGSNGVSVCESNGMRLAGEALVVGVLGLSAMPDKRGPRVVVRFFDAEDKPIAGLAGGVQVLAEMKQAVEQEKFQAKVISPAGAVMGRICVESRVEDAIFTVESLEWTL